MVGHCELTGSCADLNSWATEGKLQKGGFLKIKAFQTNFVKGKKFV